MVFLDIGRSGLALAFAGSMTPPNVIEIGEGSGLDTVTDIDLESSVLNRPFSSRNIATPRFVTFIADFGVSTMSGTNLAEFGVKISGATLFNREGFEPLTFDGTNEAQIQITFEIF